MQVVVWGLGFFFATDAKKPFLLVSVALKIKSLAKAPF